MIFNKYFFFEKSNSSFILLPTFFEIHNKLKKKFNYILINNSGYPGGLTFIYYFICLFLEKKLA